VESAREVKAAAYVRVLSAEQQREGLNNEDQRRQLETYIAERGWRLAGVHVDVGAAARPRNQPALRSLLSDLSAVDKLVVLSFDRFGRSMRRTLEIVQQLEAQGTGLVSIAEGFDTSDATGQVVPKLLAELAQWEWWTGAGANDGWDAGNLRKPGFVPATVIDVGVADGTQALYRAFPDAYHVLIEPLQEFETDLERLLEERRGEYLLTAVGAHDGTIALQVDRHSLNMSSVLRSALPRPGGPERYEVREVPVTTLDQLRERRGWPGPFGLKIDAEGFEPQVIEGARGLLEDTQFVIAEVSVIERFEGDHSFAQFIALMDSAGFGLCDILHAQKIWQSRRVGYIDAMFSRHNGA
jgi:FkbM family methyltransferase